MRPKATATVVFLLGLASLACRARTAPRWSAVSGAPVPRQVDLGLHGRAQTRNLSCESRSACDLLAHYGIPVSEDRFRAGLPVSDNPDEGFVGDVDGPTGRLPPEGYGVHAEPVAAGLRALGLPASARRGVDLAWLRQRLAEGRPVIVWATSGLDAPPPVPMHDARGRPFVAVPGEHTFLAVGYAPGIVLLVDAATGRTRRVPAGRFVASWTTLGRQAVLPDHPPAG